MSELVKVEERPSFLQQVDSEPQGISELSKHVRPSYLKIVQKMSADELIEQFGVGAIILTPDHELIAAPEGSAAEEMQGVSFIPLLFYTEWCKWASILLKGQENMIVERSFDPKSPLAIRSQSSTSWSEPHPAHKDDSRYDYRYCEHLNFIVKLTGEGLEDMQPVLISFVKSSYAAGQNLAKLSIARKASLFAGVYQLRTRSKTNSKGTFRVFTVENNGWVSDPEFFESLKSMHEMFKDLMDSRMIVTDYDEEDILEGEVVSTDY